jgi:DUF4097 and DUF4098 domain-containing protein YvlB
MFSSAKALALHALLLAALLGMGCVDLVGADFARYIERDEKRFTVSGKPDVTLSTFDGSIEIRPWDRSEVEVIVEKRAKSKEAVATIDVHAEQNGSHITVHVTNQKSQSVGFHFNDSRSAKLIVSVPASSDVDAKSGDGSIDIERIDGRITLHSGDGSIRARDLGGDVNVSTGDGSVTMDGKFAKLRAHTGDGSMRIQASRGSVVSGDWDITTGDGSVTLEIPDGFNAELDAHTGDGRIHLNDVGVADVQGEIRRNNVRGRLGSGGSALRIRTGDGSITLRRGL